MVSVKVRHLSWGSTPRQMMTSRPSSTPSANENVVDGHEIRRPPEGVSSTDGRMVVKSKNSSASIVAKGAADQVVSRYSAADDAALPASFQPENAMTSTGFCAERR